MGITCTYMKCASYVHYSPSPRHSTPITIDMGHSWRIVPQTDAQGLKKKQCSLGDLPGTKENSLAHTLAFSSKRIALRTSFSCQATNPLMPYSRPGRVAKLVTMSSEYNIMEYVKAGLMYMWVIHVQSSAKSLLGFKMLYGTNKWGVVAERSSLPDSSSGVSSRMWVRIPAVTLVSLSKTLNHNCFSPPRG